MIKELLGYLRPHRLVLFLGGLLGLIGSVAGLAMPLLAKYVVDAFGAGTIHGRAAARADASRC